jgi:hypothetical protein
MPLKKMSQNLSFNMTQSEIFKAQSAKNPLEVHYRINHKTWRMRTVGAGRLMVTAMWAFNPYHSSRPSLTSTDAPNFENNRSYMHYQHTGVVIYAGIEPSIIPYYAFYVRVGVQYWNEQVERLIPAADIDSAKDFCRGLLINY